MQSDSVSLQLCVWRPSRFQHSHMNVENGFYMDGSLFHEQIYKWETKEDILGAVTNSDLTENLRIVLIDHFNPANSFELRRIKYLENSLRVMDELLSDKSFSDWGDVIDTRRIVTNEPLHLRQHKLLALRQHIQWIYDTFSLVPDANITIR